ncbi:CACNG7 [Cordylochernes scorpioides]|uniref:CACNG7 n=1 Tax=Cordylochernes scorpioides TaxID=51811 RepID=A0ABY6LUD3_9ARAC|nr:CACNG7 [Cordylochernes scorpioides]
MKSNEFSEYAVKRAAVFIFSSTLILIIGEFLSVFGLILTKRRVLTFASGIAFILSGKAVPYSVLLLPPRHVEIGIVVMMIDNNDCDDDAGLLILMGMVIYISTFKAEVGNKLRPKSSFQGPLFIYHYGYSFLLAVTGLMTSELAGTFAIFLYIKKYEEDAKKREENPKIEEDHLPCPRHPSSGTLRWGEVSPRGSPCPEAFLPRRGPPRHAALQQSESMKDLAFCSFPPFSRDTTFNTVSTSADFAREYSHEFSFDTLRRTTPV